MTYKPGKDIIPWRTDPMFPTRTKRPNQRLIEQRGISEEAVTEIKNWYLVEDLIFKGMEGIDDPVRLRLLAEDWHKLQFHLQRLWKFKEDRNYHRFWYLPKCKCPKMDNDDNYPTGMYWKDESCPIHGDFKRDKVA